MKTLIRGAFVMTMAGGHIEKPQRQHIWLEDDRIGKIGFASSEEEAQADVIIEADGMLALPGLVNAHNHSPMSLFRSFCDDLRLMDWLEQKIIPAEAQMTPDDIYIGAMLAIAEMIKCGTTCFADMYIHMDRVAQAVLDSGIRASLCRGLVFQEDDGGRRLREAIELVDKWTGAGGGRIATMLGPHAPYTCPPEAMRHVIDLARARDIPVHTHLAETVEETALMASRYGKSPTRYLAELGLFDGSVHVMLAHAVHVDEADTELLAGMRGGIVHNPFSNLKLGCGFAPIVRFRNAGIEVALGTDGAGSASSLDLFKEMRLAAGLQKALLGDPTAISAGQALHMATAGGANVLGLGHNIGSLEPGKQADLILVRLGQPHLAPVHDPVSLLVYAANGADVDTTIVAGRVLMRGRKLTTIDEAALVREAELRACRLGGRS